MSQNGRATVQEPIDALAYYHFSVAQPASKAVFDALRWEIGHGRLRRIKRALYGPGVIPRSTEHRICKRVLTLQDEAAAIADRLPD